MRKPCPPPLLIKGAVRVKIGTRVLALLTYGDNRSVVNLFIGTGVLSVPTSATNSGAVYLLLITLACGEEKGAGGCMWWCLLWCARRASCAGGERLRCASTTNIVKRVAPAVSPGVYALVTGAAPGSYKSPFLWNLSLCDPSMALPTVPRTIYNQVHIGAVEAESHM